MKIGSIHQLAFSLAIATAVGGAALAHTYDLALVNVAAEATFVDLANLKKTGETTSFRALVVARTGQPQVGGWRQMSVDCEQNEYRTLAVHQVSETGEIGPEELLSGQVFPIVSSSAEDAMAGAVCDKTAMPVRAPNIVEATKIGRARLSQIK